MPTPPEALAALQKRFADHIRDPENNPAPDGIEDRRLAIYRRLFLNNLSSLFGKNFPIARKTVSDEQWRAIIRAFMVEHRPTTPLFPEIGREFVRFLADHPEHYRQWPWLAEICHWQFLATSVRNDESEPAEVDADPDGDLLTESPVVNPTLRLAQYRWPVHEIRSRTPPGEPKPVVLTIFRKPDDRLGRIQINAATARLLELLQENSGISGQVCLERLAGEIGHADPAVMIEHGARILESLLRKSALLGTAGKQAAA